MTDTPQSPSSAISTGTVQLIRQYTGRGPTKARTEIGPDRATILLEDLLTKGETTLVEKGLSDRVLQIRHDFQMAMRDDLVALVEKHAKRKVTAFMSANHIDPDMAAEIFVLGPAL